MWIKTLTLALCLTLAGACTLSHSKQAIEAPGAASPRADATFVTEEDSGLQLFGVLQLSEPDHYAVLLERARRRHKCDRMTFAQLDFFTDHWLIVAFPVSRITLICERSEYLGQAGTR